MTIGHEGMDMSNEMISENEGKQGSLDDLIEKGKNKGLPADFWSVGSPVSLLNCLESRNRFGWHKLPIRNN